jgi:hypothetical protein
LRWIPSSKSRPFVNIAFRKATRKKIAGTSGRFQTSLDDAKYSSILLLKVQEFGAGNPVNEREYSRRREKAG